MTLKEGHKILNRVKRMADDNPIEKSQNLEAPTSNPLPAKRPRSEEVVTDDNNTNYKVQAIPISSAPPRVQTLASTEQTIVPETDDAVFATKHSSIGELIDNHFNNEKYNEKVKKRGLGGCCNAIQAYSIRAASLARRMVLEFDDLEKEKDAHLKQIAELQNKLFESEKNLANMTSIKDEEMNILKEELSLEKSEWIKREEELMEENRKITLKLQMLENTHKVTADKLMAEMEELKAGFDKAFKHVLASLS